MDTPEFPPNSEVSKRRERLEEEKDVHQITKGKTIRKRKSLRKQFKDTFVAGDLRSTAQYVLLDVALPMAKDMVVEAGASGLEKLIFGDARRRGSTPPQSGPTGYIQYNAMSRIMGRGGLSSSQRAISRAARSRHDFDEIILDSRGEAEEVIDRLFDIVEKYEQATVGDLYELVGLASTHTDRKWGWTNVRGAGVSRTRDGYLLDLPEPHPLD
jgi:hypothetical protein